MSSLAGTAAEYLLPAERHSDLDPASCHFGVFFLPDEVELRGSDVAVSRKFPHLVHLPPFRIASLMAVFRSGSRFVM